MFNVWFQKWRHIYTCLSQRRLIYLDVCVRIMKCTSKQWWSTIPPRSTGIICDNFSMSNGFQPTYSIFLASSQLTKSIHWFCYCTVHVFLSFISICIAVDTPLTRWDGRNFINQFNTATFLFLSQGINSIYKAKCHWVFFVLSDLRWKVIIRFVVIDPLVDHHWLIIFYKWISKSKVHINHNLSG